MLAIIAKYQFASTEGTDQFCEHAKKIVAPSRAEDGCTIYSFARDIEDDKVVWISEEWESQEALTAHLKQAFIAEFLANIADIEIVAGESRQYEVSSVGPVVMPE